MTLDHDKAASTRRLRRDHGERLSDYQDIDLITSVKWFFMGSIIALFAVAIFVRLLLLGLGRLFIKVAKR